MTPLIAAVVQARMSSQRLPGKSMMPLGGRPLVEWVATRAAAASHIGTVAIATSSDTGDDPIADLAARLRVPCIRGSLDDVLDRYRMATQILGATVVVRLTGDCPLVDPDIVDLAIETFIAEDADFASTNLAEECPHGLDVEVARGSALLQAADQAEDEVEREHVMPFLYRRPERFRCVAVPIPEWARHPELRLTVDQSEDLEVVREIVRRLGGGPGGLRARDAVRLLLEDPSLRAVNASVPHRRVR